ncbi:MAG: bifunctional UDP-N-acetylglucosamine diphosphorylase/glucosamine-1-phosphate N-acetyltransferase GlmU [Holosporaceae bacterium]|jgi:bifunctional UDP-N-acetylglucosamine pyrophosphorylase/glucosamine-1-phosphate N-acetyltransferase|nr:bifunctional UDP-N-acetylglucosamine diphosphorylase/glucosamine-1-phosphate N-acetyltransferase GlmU [Holosporaceae bacterium]
MEKSYNSVIILAAGIGSRMKSDIPKVFQKIGGLSLLDHVITAAKGINPDVIIAVLNPRHKNFDFDFGREVIKVYQKEQKGTADAVKCGLQAADEVEGWVYILYGDIPLVSSDTLMKLSEVSRKSADTALVVLAIGSENTKDLGRLEPADEKGTVKSIVEAKDNVSSKTISLCNAGLLIKKSLLKRFINEIKPSGVTGEFYITEIVRLIHEAGYICRYHKGTERELSGANTVAELALLERNFQEREREKHMKNGVLLTAPETVFFSHDTIAESGVTVRPYVVFSRGVCLESGSEVGPFCLLEGTTVRNAAIGPFARLRGESLVKEGAKVGNFVEVKNSTISEGTKVNHLSYVGDSDIGKNTNIGAGTVTCNYDGFKKHKTVIGENVFVGSNASLVAPVTVGNDSFIGAGSVITDDVEEGSLALERSSRRSVKGWTEFRKKKKCAES